MEEENKGTQDKKTDEIQPKSVDEDIVSTPSIKNQELSGSAEEGTKRSKEMKEPKNTTESARVMSGRTKRTRFGRGFSLAELGAAKISLARAKKSSLFIDFRRNTIYEENVKKIEDSFAV